jgi:monoamine oxidase
VEVASLKLIMFFSRKRRATFENRFRPLTSRSLTLRYAYSMHDVLIVGAGAAGLIAAKTLHAAGFDVAVCEGRDRIGGRIRTERRGGKTIELGAEFIHGKPQTTLALAREAGLELVKSSDLRLFRENGRLDPLPQFWDVIEKVNGQMDAARDETYEEFLARAKASFAEKHLARFFAEGFNAARADLIGTVGLATADEAAGRIDSKQQFRLVSGYGELMEWLAGQIPAEAIHLDAAVREICWQRGRVRLLVEGNNGVRKYEATCAVVTISLGVLQTSPRERGAIAFDPPLVAKAEALQHLHMGPVTKVAIRFRKPFWESHGHFGFVLADQSAFSTWWTQEPDASDVLTGWVGGAAAEKLAGRSRDELGTSAIGSLAEIFGESPRRLRELMDEIHFHDWGADPFSRGAYSYPGVGGIQAARALATPIDYTLFFAGEATDFRGASGTVHGALDSGLRVAREIGAEIQPRKRRMSRER